MLTMQPLKAPGVVGLHAVFYQSQWHVVEESACNLVKNVFTGNSVLSEVNKTLIVLIPKTKHPNSLKLYRPISLCIVFYKTITKIVANRIKVILPDLIGPTQASFVARRHITENIVVAQDIIHNIRMKKGKRGQMLIKVDLEKAYGRLSWEFIHETLCEAGILPDLIRTTMDCNPSATMQILWNSELLEKNQLKKTFKTDLIQYIGIRNLENHTLTI